MSLQVIEVALGLFAAFFVLSVISSAILSAIGGGMKKRSNDLWSVIERMIADTSSEPNDSKNIKSTSIYKSLEMASRSKRRNRRAAGSNADKRQPSYMSARAFADASVELLTKLGTGAQSAKEAIERLPEGPLRNRMIALYSELGEDVQAIKAGLEGWFDDVMDRLEGAFQRWTRWVLFIIGFVIAAMLNVSTFHVVDALWNDATLRKAVADRTELLVADCTPNDTTCEPPTCPPDEDAKGGDAAAPATTVVAPVIKSTVPTGRGDGGDQGGEETTDPVPPCTDAEKVDHAIDTLAGLELPVGWGDSKRERPTLARILGWLATASAVTLGAPFWFDLITRLVGLRGGKPPKARDDETSSTAAVARQAAKSMDARSSTGRPLLSALVGAATAPTPASAPPPAPTMKPPPSPPAPSRS